MSSEFAGGIDSPEALWPCSTSALNTGMEQHLKIILENNRDDNSSSYAKWESLNLIAGEFVRLILSGEQERRSDGHRHLLHATK
jgi:hypothetical protein